MDLRSGTVGPADTLTSPHYPEYASYHKRLRTFTWERQIGCFTVEELAEAGFFVSDLITNSKALFCFHCNLFVSERTLRSAESLRELESLHNQRCEHAQKSGRRERVPVVVPRRRNLNPPVPDEASAVISSAPKDPLRMNASMTFGRSLEEDSDSDVFEGDDSEVSGSLEVYSATKSMATYKERLSSFANWPADHPQDPRTFAKYGMFYTGVEDRTQCCSCGVIIWGWEPYRGDPKAPLLAHKKFEKLYQQCKFIRGRSWSNKVAKLNPVGAMINWDKATSPQMISDTDRLKTFEQISQTDSSKAVALADAGFYLLPNRQIIKCFYCGIGVELSQHEYEDPWTLHARLTMGCTFLNRRKGLLFVHRARRTLAVENDGQAGGERSATRKYLDRIVPARLRDLHRNSKLVENIMSAFGGTSTLTAADAEVESVHANSYVEPASTSQSMNRPHTPTAPITEITHIVRDVINMGFTAKQVEKALDELSRIEPEQAPDRESLVQTILDTEDRRRRHRLNSSRRRSAVEIDQVDRTVQVEAERESVEDRAGTGARRQSETEVKVCAICMEQPANMAFIPCGHVESCRKCSKALQICHICREPIESRIRVYI